ncbi:outer membrane lipoprotein carrier protein LolA [Microbulbifer magnicolonia]|uniref:LolA family protein n=1 Tax=Microbulbifer magnicolonia TaxID=3109744 RepID=UPI002B40BE8F|nr:outer membrane lipoprotein carrier protein LolA [Microbulbifer sp. GG15]
MRILFFAAILCAALLSPAATLASEISQRAALEQIEERLQKAPQMLGRFTQKKTLPQLPRPLLSSGVVALSEERGVSWRVVEPIASHLILNEAQAGDDLLAKQIAYPLLQIFRGNFAALEQLFRVEAQMLDNRWEVTLEPKDSALAKFVSSIEVSGNSSIERIRLAEASAAITEMQLLELQPVSDSDPQFTAEFSQQ